MRMSKERRENLRRMANGWVPMRPQVVDWKWYANHGFVRVDWGPEGSGKQDKMCLLITDKGRAEAAQGIELEAKP